MFSLVARIAQCFAVIYIKAKFWMRGLMFDVMGAKVFSLAAFHTLLISVLNGRGPFCKFGHNVLSGWNAAFIPERTVVRKHG